MTLDEQYAHAALPPGWCAFGQRLRPIAIGHLLVLQRDGSPFLVGGLPCPEHVVSALWVGARSGGDAFAQYSSKSIGFRLAWRGVRIALLCRLSPKRFTEGVWVINQWLNDAKEPGVFIGGDGKQVKHITAPPLLHYTRLLLSAGLSMREAMDCPLSQARWLSCACSESVGLLTFVTDAQRECAERNSKRIQEWKSRTC